MLAFLILILVQTYCNDDSDALGILLKRIYDPSVGKRFMYSWTKDSPEPRPVYSDGTFQDMIVESIRDGDFRTFTEVADRITTRGSVTKLDDLLLSTEKFKSLEEVDDSKYSKLANELNKPQLNHRLLRYARNHNSAEIFMIVYHFTNAGDISDVLDDSDDFVYSGVKFKELFPLLKAALPDKKFKFHQYFFKYFCALSSRTFENEDVPKLEAIKQFAISHIEHYYFRIHQFGELLSRTDLRNFITLEHLKTKLKDNIKSNYLYYRPNGPSLKPLDNYYRNVGIMTDNEWIKGWNTNYEANWYKNDANANIMWQAYRGAAISQCNAMAIVN
eukprot:NODE_313_length_11219_cov_0.287770.p4 type:complete len:331 gc:universal NODE_313_length_11219_cov_0.287770:6273-7265(+)